MDLGGVEAYKVAYFDVGDAPLSDEPPNMARRVTKPGRQRLNVNEFGDRLSHCSSQAVRRFFRWFAAAVAASQVSPSLVWPVPRYSHSPWATVGSSVSWPWAASGDGVGRCGAG
jgi:hypothetical protein